MGMSGTTPTYGILIPVDNANDAVLITDIRSQWNAIEDLLDGTTTNKTFSLGGAIARSDDTVLAIGRAFTGTASANLYHARIGGTITEAASGTHAVIAGLRIDAITITDGGGSEAVTSLAALYIAAAPTAGSTPTNGPFAIFVDAGNVRFDGTLTMGGTLSPTATDGAALGSASLMWSDLFVA